MSFVAPLAFVAFGGSDCAVMYARSEAISLLRRTHQLEARRRVPSGSPSRADSGSPSIRREPLKRARGGARYICTSATRAPWRATPRRRRRAARRRWRRAVGVARARAARAALCAARTRELINLRGDPRVTVAGLRASGARRRRGTGSRRRSTGTDSPAARGRAAASGPKARVLRAPSPLVPFAQSDEAEAFSGAMASRRAPGSGALGRRATEGQASSGYGEGEEGEHRGRANFLAAAVGSRSGCLGLAIRQRRSDAARRARARQRAEREVRSARTANAKSAYAAREGAASRSVQRRPRCTTFGSHFPPARRMDVLEALARTAWRGARARARARTLARAAPPTAAPPSRAAARALGARPRAPAERRRFAQPRPERRSHRSSARGARLLPPPPPPRAAGGAPPRGRPADRRRQRRGCAALDMARTPTPICSRRSPAPLRGARARRAAPLEDDECCARVLRADGRGGTPRARRAALHAAARARRSLHGACLRVPSAPPVPRRGCRARRAQCAARRGVCGIAPRAARTPPRRRAGAPAAVGRRVRGARELTRPRRDAARARPAEAPPARGGDCLRPRRRRGPRASSSALAAIEARIAPAARRRGGSESFPYVLWHGAVHAQSGAALKLAARGGAAGGAGERSGGRGPRRGSNP